MNLLIAAALAASAPAPAPPAPNRHPGSAGLPRDRGRRTAAMTKPRRKRSRKPPTPRPTRIRRRRGCSPPPAICGSPRASRARRRSISTRRSPYPGLEAEQRGEALLDRARAAEAQSDLKTARAKLTEAAATISDDPFYWYFSAALAVRENDAATAQAAINKALALAPADPDHPVRGRPCRPFHRRRGGEPAPTGSAPPSAIPSGAIGKAARDALTLLRPAHREHGSRAA